ncbi:KilA-N domain-containing protein, partial [Pasteurella multocida]
MTNLAILNNSIRTLNNLYSLADLHRASGNDPKHRPTYFLRNDQTKALIAEIESENPTCEKSHSSVLIVKNGVGTYACKELVIAYAAWISPAFHLTVLRAFLNQVEQPQQLALPEPKPRGILLDEEAFYVVAKAIAKLNESTFEWEKMMDLFS